MSISPEKIDNSNTQEASVMGDSPMKIVCLNCKKEGAYREPPNYCAYCGSKFAQSKARAGSTCVMT